MKKMLQGLFLFIVISLCAVNTAFAKNVSVTLNGSLLPLSSPAVIQNDRVLVPLRSIMEALGYDVVWNSAERTVEAEKGSTTLKLTIGSNTATVNGTAVSLDAPAAIIQSNTFVPLRFVAVHSGASVVWDSTAYNVIITTEDYVQENITDSVVYIQTNKMQGSGVVLSSDGLIVTNYHVMENASMVQFVFNDGSVYQGDVRIVALDAQGDIVILKVNKNGLTPAATSTKIAVGDSVRAVGSPNGNRNTISSGVILGYNSDIIESSAVINHGSSGGGLFDKNDRLIGITSAFSTGHYFAIPISRVLALSHDYNMTLSDFKNYEYIPSAPREVSYTIDGDYAYVYWSPVINADYYYVYISHSANGSFTKLENDALGSHYWYWGFPYCFGISGERGGSIYMRISAVCSGVETPLSKTLKISLD